MKIHYSTLTPRELYQAAENAGVEIVRDKYSGSQTHTGKVDVILNGSSNHRKNFSRYDDEGKAATWDEWGMFLYGLFKADENIVAGPYTSELLFHMTTRDRFKMIANGEVRPHTQHKWNNVAPYEFECKCGAQMTNFYHPDIQRVQAYDKETQAERKAARKAERAAARVGA